MAKKQSEPHYSTLRKLGLNGLHEALLCAPAGYYDFTRARDILSRPGEGKMLFCLTVLGKQGYTQDGLEARHPREIFRFSIQACDASGNEVILTIFGNVWPWMWVKAESQLYVYGEITKFKEILQVNAPMLVNPSWVGKVVPFYRGKQGVVSGEKVEAAVKDALELLDDASRALSIHLGMSEREASNAIGYNSLHEFLSELHGPPSVLRGKKALEAAEHLSILHILRAAKERPAPVPESSLSIPRTVFDQAIRSLPYSLTGDQQRAVSEILDDLRSPVPMRRLLSGEVGSGKTLTYLIPAVAAHNCGYKAGVLVPNALLVKQVADNIRGHFPGVDVCEVTAGMQIQEGLVVGTTAVLHAAHKSGWTPDFLIVDEQQKFSREQRESVMGPHSNLLEATATPFPRSMALMLYGGMDYSVLRQTPFEKRIRTHVIHAKDRVRLMEHVYRVVQAGKQCAFIYPLVESGEDEIRGVESAFRMWNEKFPGKVGMLHGKMNESDKLSVIQKMHSREFSILVSSTVVEIGVHLPDLHSLTVVEAEKYGLSQLHQLRGRVARNGGSGHFFLYLPREQKEETLQRMHAMVNCSDGFTLSEMDMKIRGIGDFTNKDDQSGKLETLFRGITLEIDAIARVEREMFAKAAA